jgi:hypothetical protein
MSPERKPATVRRYWMGALAAVTVPSCAVVFVDGVDPELAATFVVALAMSVGLVTFSILQCPSLATGWLIRQYT